MTCQIAGCANEANWHPVLLLYAPAEYGDTPPMNCELGMDVCDTCMAITTVEKFLPEKAFEQICDGFRRAQKVLPDKSRTKLAWMRREDSLIRKFNSARNN